MNDTNASTPEPDGGRSPGQKGGGGVPPNETPPAEGTLSGAGPEETPHNPTSGWSTGPLIAIGLLVLVFVVYFVARIILA
ncbi:MULTISPECIES: DUF6480 family protein [unclassified Streptomyces]|uniref:DUF6480 family protein n=1 Tax=unclassified Streptomyces TaxID=2593676 RepID=UPI0022B60BCC|nr:MULTISPECIES: DUF6480 family protein [unclassified Streptomyces]MCZ7415757.1 DUF6480 family protein [Streptomyces sp. WMMC897]MCZ7434432.1 DUF6480 family protein [Streptomyces sp. WMMC1477]